MSSYQVSKFIVQDKILQNELLSSDSFIVNQEFYNTAHTTGQAEVEV